VENLPVVQCDADRLAAGLPVIELLVLAGLAATNGAARRLIRGGGARLNDEVLDDETLVVATRALRDGALKLSAGKKRHVLVRPVRAAPAPA
jgi:tyrosyl-tRNA synthetase